MTFSDAVNLSSSGEPFVQKQSLSPFTAVWNEEKDVGGPLTASLGVLFLVRVPFPSHNLCCSISNTFYTLLTNAPCEVEVPSLLCLLSSSPTKSQNAGILIPRIWKRFRRPSIIRRALDRVPIIFLRIGSSFFKTSFSVVAFQPFSVSPDRQPFSIISVTWTMHILFPL